MWTSTLDFFFKRFLPWWIGLLTALTVAECVDRRTAHAWPIVLSQAPVPEWALHTPTNATQIVGYILKLRPQVGQARAAALAALLMRRSPDPALSVAIIMQESAFQDVHTEFAGIDTLTARPAHVVKDLGIAQLNWGTVLEFRCDARKLLDHDLDEAIRCHSLVLHAKLILCSDLGRDAWSCYNSKSAVPRREYARAVRRWLKKMGVER